MKEKIPMNQIFTKNQNKTETLRLKKLTIRLKIEFVTKKLKRFRAHGEILGRNVDSFVTKIKTRDTYILFSDFTKTYLLKNTWLHKLLNYLFFFRKLLNSCYTFDILRSCV